MNPLSKTREYFVLVNPITFDSDVEMGKLYPVKCLARHYVFYPSVNTMYFVDVLEDMNDGFTIHELTPWGKFLDCIRRCKNAVLC